jgi:hypothetical protein
MSLALCFNCGNVKFGALCECEECGTGSTGNVDLDILFSDWNYCEEVLEKFGNVIVQIHRHTDNQRLVFLTFLRFVSNEYPGIVNINVDGETLDEIEKILEKLEIERFEIE